MLVGAGLCADEAVMRELSHHIGKKLRDTEAALVLYPSESRPATNGGLYRATSRSASDLRTLPETPWLSC
jgi:hypothetical protein